MKMMFNAFGKKLFGSKYERLLKNLFISVVCFTGMKSADISLYVAPFIIYFSSFAFTFGIMVTALNSKDALEQHRHMVMMPFSDKSLIFSYISATGLYVLLTRTMMLWALIFSINKLDVKVLICAVLAGGSAVCLCAAVYANKKLRAVSFILMALLIGSIFVLRESFGEMNAFVMMGFFGIAMLLSLLILNGADGYIFYDAAVSRGANAGKRISHKHNLVWTYLFRYLFSHKNYLVNSAVLLVLAVAIPFVLTDALPDKEITKYFIYIGFAILSVNTPLYILISCDKDLEKGIRTLPGGGKTFLLPYGAFIFTYICTAYTVFLVSWNIKYSSVDARVIALGVILAVIGTIVATALEYCCPITKWENETDLWHHPRKYIVPVVVLLLGGLLGMVFGI